jgi:lysophospholipase L1-like esterase
MISGSKELTKLFSDIEFDMEIGIHFPTAIDKVRAHRDAGQLGPIVLIHLGNNGGFAASHFDEMMTILRGHKVIFVNLKVPRQWEAYNNKVLADGVKRYPGTKLIDWYSASYTHYEYFWEDGFHLRPEGAKTYATLIAASLKAVS